MPELYGAALRCERKVLRLATETGLVERERAVSGRIIGWSLAREARCVLSRRMRFDGFGADAKKALGVRGPFLLHRETTQFKHRTNRWRDDERRSK